MLKWLSSTLILVIVTLGIVTYLALELSDVAEIHTNVPSSDDVRVTHIWYVENEHGLLLEAGNPNNPWVRDLKDVDGAYIAAPASLEGTYRLMKKDASSHTEIRRQMRQKYGWRDVWIELLFNPTESFLIEASRSERRPISHPPK